jgi:hypothetical protein
MLGSPTTPDRDAPRDNAAPRVAFRVGNPVGVRNFNWLQVSMGVGGGRYSGIEMMGERSQIRRTS